jgi:DNA-directed RNA polymerase specialized sigma24 family protein
MPYPGRPPPEQPSGPVQRLDQIETDWARVNEPGHFVMRYGLAIERYVHALIANAHDAEELAQEFFAGIIEMGLPRVRQERGRFRDYLKKVVRNRAITFLRRKQAGKLGGDLRDIPATEQPDSIEAQEWLRHWRRCLLHRTWRRLKEHHPTKKTYYRVLQLCARHPQEDSETLAARASRVFGVPIRTDAFRQQLSRARRLFAQFLIAEVADTLDQPTAAEVEAELAELELTRYIRCFLPLHDRDVRSKRR